MPWNPFSKTRRFKCPGNRQIEVFKNPRDAFPLFTRNWSAQLKVAADTATQLSGEIGGEFASRMSGLFILLDETNGSMQMQLSAIYQYYSEDPCNREVWFQGRLERTLDEVTLLKRAKIELEALRILAEKGEAQDKLIHYVVQMMDRLKMSDDELSRRRAFEEASKTVGLWQQKERTGG